MSDLPVAVGNGASPLALARPQGAQESGAIVGLALMTPEEFDTRLAMLKTGVDRLKRIHQSLMEPGVDYGVIPGTGDKPTLLKPGAEKLCQFYDLHAEFRVETRYGDGETAPPVSVHAECLLHRGCLAGPVVASGHGNASSWEVKYRYRKEDRSCPDCGVYGSVIKGKAEYGGGWICFKKKGGCGQKFGERDERITSQVVGTIENPDQLDLANTILKMGCKRAFIDAALRGTATSGLYTQDLVDQQSADQEPRETPATGRNGARSEVPANGSSSTNGNGALTCARPECGRSITRGQHEMSVKNYGKGFCPSCQKLQSRSAERAAEPPVAREEAPAEETPEQAIARLRKAYHPAFEEKFGRLPDAERYAIEGVLCKWPHPLKSGSKSSWSAGNWQSLLDRLEACDAEDVKRAAEDLLAAA